MKNTLNNQKEVLINNLQGCLPSLRKRFGISQSQLGEFVGLSRQTISGIERGTIPMTWTVYLAILYFIVLNSNNIFCFADGPDFGDIDMDSVQQILHIEKDII